MTNKKIIDLTQDSAPDPTDVTITVDDPSGTAANKKVTWKDAVEAGISTADATATGEMQFNDLRVNEAVKVTATSTEINKIDGFTGTYEDLNYAKDLNATGVSASEFDTLDGITATTAELNKLAGASANVTAANLGTLTAGAASDADALHTHDSFTSEFKSGVFARDPSTASGSQTIAHGGSKTPKLVLFSMVHSYASSGTWEEFNDQSEGSYDGSSNKCIYRGENDMTTSSSYCIYSLQSTGNSQSASCAVDATNITLTRTKTGTPTGSGVLVHWIAYF